MASSACPNAVSLELRGSRSARQGRADFVGTPGHPRSRDRSLQGADANALDLIRRSGELYVYEKPRSYALAKEWHDLRRRRGVEVVDVPPEELRQLEPALAPIFCGGVYLPTS